MNFPTIKSHKDIQDELAKKLDDKGKQYFRCPDCGEVYKLASGLVSCGQCGYLRDDYERATNGKSIIKKHEN